MIPRTRRWKKRRGRAPLKRIAPRSMYGFGRGSTGQGMPYYINREVPVPVPAKDPEWYDKLNSRLDAMEAISGKGESILKKAGGAVRAGAALAKDTSQAAMQTVVAGAIATALVAPQWVTKKVVRTTAGYGKDVVIGLKRAAFEGEGGDKPADPVPTVPKTTKDVVKNVLYKAGNVTQMAANVTNGVLSGIGEFASERIPNKPDEPPDKRLIFFEQSTEIARDVLGADEITISGISRIYADTDFIARDPKNPSAVFTRYWKTGEFDVLPSDSTTDANWGRFDSNVPPNLFHSNTRARNSMGIEL